MESNAGQQFRGVKGEGRGREGWGGGGGGREGGRRGGMWE